MTAEQTFDGTIFRGDLSHAGAARWEGYVERIDPTAIRGWCCDLENPDRSLLVELVSGNGSRAVTAANIHRQDVKEAGFGNGKHGFELDVGGLVLGEAPFVVRIAESRVALTAEPLALSLPFSLLQTVFSDDFTLLMQRAALDVRARWSNLEANGRAAA